MNRRTDQVRDQDYYFKESSLKKFCEQVLVSVGLSLEDARIVADSLIRADLEGNSGHGISRLPIYVKRIGEGRIAARPDIRIDASGSVLQVDGGNGLGHIASMRALDAAAKAAKHSGIAAAFIRNSNHFGTAAYYCQRMSDRGLALIATTNSPPGIAPWGGKQAFLGTNPIAFGFPAKDRPHVIVDMSSSIVARGKIILADKEGRDIPRGWAIDAEGAETTDPKLALQGSVLPLGGAKGYALAMAVEIMSAVLSGAAYGPHVNNLYKDGDGPANVGHSFIVLDLNKWLSMDDYYAGIDQFLDEIKGSPLASGAEAILYPGERRESSYQRNMQAGIKLSPEVCGELMKIGREWNVSFPMKNCQ